MANRKVIHAADIHLDSPLQKLGAYEHAPVERIRGASRRALENLVAMAIERAVDLVVVPGDLYDGDWPDQNTGLFFVAQANRLVKAGIRVAVIRGNHDAANVMTQTLPLPHNPDGSEIMLSSDSVDLRRFDDIGIAVHGRSFRNRAETENMAADYPTPIGGLFNIGLLHTSLTGAVGHDPYAPCTPAQLAEKRYDYWALGHVHARGDHAIDGSAPIVFSGNLQGRHIREEGPKGCILIEIDSNNRCSYDFHEMDVVRWQTCTVNASAMQHVDEVLDDVQQWLRRAIGTLDGNRLLVMRVELTGATALHQSLLYQSKQIRASLQAITVAIGGEQVWLEDLTVATRPEAGNPVSDIDGPLESLSAVLQEIRSDTSGAIEPELRSLLRRLPAELSGANGPLPIEDPDWLDRLLDVAAADVSERFKLKDLRS